jgi:hypothetical protein
MEGRVGVLHGCRIGPAGPTAVLQDQPRTQGGFGGTNLGMLNSSLRRSTSSVTLLCSCRLPISPGSPPIGVAAGLSPGDPEPLLFGVPSPAGVRDPLFGVPLVVFPA